MTIPLERRPKMVTLRLRKRTIVKQLRVKMLPRMKQLLHRMAMPEDSLKWSENHSRPFLECPSIVRERESEYLNIRSVILGY